MYYSETQTELFQADKNTRLLSRQWLTEKKLKAVFIVIHGGLAHCGDWVTPALFFKTMAKVQWPLTSSDTEPILISLSVLLKSLLMTMRLSKDIMRMKRPDYALLWQQLKPELK